MGFTVNGNEANVTNHSTKYRILDAAEKLFADKGVDGTSIREICHTAGANQAAVNYYFKKKQDLVRAVVERRMTNITARRTLLLDAIDQVDEPQVRDYVLALVIPLAELIENEEKSGQAFMAIVARLLHERADLVWSIILKHNSENLDRILGGLSKTTSGLSIEILSNRLTLSVSIVLHWLAKPVYFSPERPSINPNSSKIEDSYELIDFIVGGITAPLNQEL